jgi:hypothetical protein
MLDAQLFLQPQRTRNREHIHAAYRAVRFFYRCPEHRTCYGESRRMQTSYDNTSMLGAANKKHPVAYARCSTVFWALCEPHVEP